jgi:hypothetical protein
MEIDGLLLCALLLRSTPEGAGMIHVLSDRLDPVVGALCQATQSSSVSLATPRERAGFASSAAAICVTGMELSRPLLPAPKSSEPWENNPQDGEATALLE